MEKDGCLFNHVVRNYLLRYTNSPSISEKNSWFGWSELTFICLSRAIEIELLRENEIYMAQLLLVSTRQNMNMDESDHLDL